MDGWEPLQLFILPMARLSGCHQLPQRAMWEGPEDQPCLEGLYSQTQDWKRSRPESNPSPHPPAGCLIILKHYLLITNVCMPLNSNSWKMYEIKCMPYFYLIHFSIVWIVLNLKVFSIKLFEFNCLNWEVGSQYTMGCL